MGASCLSGSDCFLPIGILSWGDDGVDVKARFTYLTAVSLLTLLLTRGCKESTLVEPQPEPPIDPPIGKTDYLPLKPGNRWVFDFYHRAAYSGGYRTTYEGKLTWHVTSTSTAGDTVRYRIAQSFTGMRIHSEFYTPPIRTDTAYFTNSPAAFTFVQLPDTTLRTEPEGGNLDNQLLSVLQLARVKRFSMSPSAPDTLKIGRVHVIYFICSVFLVKDKGVVSYEIAEGGNHTWYTKATLDSSDIE
jgi:hypothetical protein